jgi:hypothetical protein
MGGGGAEGGAIGGGAAEGDASGGGGTEYAALGIGGGADSRASSAALESWVSGAGGVGGGRPINVVARGRMGGSPPSDSPLASGGGGDALGDVAGLDAASAEALTEEMGGGGGSDPVPEGVNCTRIGCCMTRVTSFESSATHSGAVSLESSAPQSVSISSVDGGVDGRIDGASLALGGGTEDDNP